jgi:hypothetical protein
MTEGFERPAPRRRARPAADDAIDPMDTGTVPPRPPDTAALLAPASTAPRQAVAPPHPRWPVPEPQRSPAPVDRALVPRAASGAYVTLNVRVAPEVDQLINRVMAETGMTKRAAVEQALRQTYGG